jgi:hypothetical protein
MLARSQNLLLLIAASIAAAAFNVSAADNVTATSITASNFKVTNFSATNLTATNFKIEGSAETKLLQLAKNRFRGDIWREEEKLFKAVTLGETADLRDAPENKVRADRIAWVCTDVEASALVTSKGIRMVGAQIVGRLLLEWARLSFQLEIEDCVFAEPINLSFCHLRALSLRRSEIKGLDADGIKSDDDVLLNGGFNAHGPVSLVRVTIGGRLDCSDGKFGDGKDYAINARSARIDGSVSFSGKFHADGQVDLSGATIGGGLDCANGQFVQDGINSQYALNADSAKINGTVSLIEGFEAVGTVRFANANVGHAFLLRHVKINDRTSLDLRFMKAATLLNEELSWPREARLYLDGLVYEELDDDASPLAKIQVGWLNRQPKIEFKSQPYEQLATVLRHMGREEEAVNVLVAKNDDHGRHPQGLLDWFWYSLVGKLIGYGYRPTNALTLSLLVISIGTLIFTTGYRWSLLTPRDDRAYVISNCGMRQVSDDYPRFNAFIYSLETFVPLVKLQVEQYWIPNANRGAEIHVGKFVLPKSGAVLRWYLWFHIIAGWILTTLWVGGLTGVLKT